MRRNDIFLRSKEIAAQRMPSLLLLLPLLLPDVGARATEDIPSIKRNGGRHRCQPPLRRAKDMPVFVTWSA